MATHALRPCCACRPTRPVMRCDCAPAMSAARSRRRPPRRRRTASSCHRRAQDRAAARHGPMIAGCSPRASFAGRHVLSSTYGWLKRYCTGRLVVDLCSASASLLRVGDSDASLSCWAVAFADGASAAPGLCGGAQCSVGAVTCQGRRDIIASLICCAPSNMPEP